MSSNMVSASSEFDYDVFLILRDAKGSVGGYVGNKLRDAGITVFVDEEGGGFSVHEATERSRIVMVLFTPEFLESEMCLRRLEERIKWWDNNLLAVYCGVIRQQVHDKLGPLFVRFASVPSLNLSLDFRNKISSPMANFGLSMLHGESFFDLPCHQVGLPVRERELLNVLGLKYILSDDTIIIGIWGDGGIGKTTIAKAIYDRIGGIFEGKSFLSNIKDAWNKYNGEVLVKKQLISDISEIELDDTNVVVMHEQMKQVLCGRRVLVVLDDVNSEFQLEELCGNVKWCGRGSLIFITARDKAIFDASADLSYEMKRLNNEESLELFCLHAFKKFTPLDDFEDFSERAIEYCEGLPLVLEVFGSLLHNRTKEEWEAIMNNMVGIPHDAIQKKLKIICDLLTDIEKDLFYNIACFHVGQSIQYVTQLLRGSRSDVEIGMSIIIEHNLVKAKGDKLYVHDLLQEIGRKISPPKPKPIYSYDVFISFRGDDSRKSFTSHLYAALKQVGIEVYMDEERIERQENIPSSLLKAIESSRIAIVVLSKNYADSSWCLQELEKIMECHRTTYQAVLPIFFDVRPFEVHKQQNFFGKAWGRFIKRSSSREMKKLIINFKRALTEVSNLSGWNIHDYRTETELIDDVIETVTKKLGDNKYLFVAHHPVGLNSRIQNILQVLQSKSTDVIIVGIWGMGGIGKTTVAKAIYNEVGQSFEGKCFLANVRDAWKQENGQVYLQEQLLSDILKSKRMVLGNVDIGKTMLEQMLCTKRVLVVLDDVNNEDQLRALCGNREWFGQGSRIVLTTRDKHLLEILRVIHVYTMRELDDNESLELFSWHAFRQAIPEQDFIELSRKVVSYSGGLPLALEIFGSYLFDREILIWESVLEKLQHIPNDQIYEKLKLSFDSLDRNEREIFLNIVSLYIGEDMNDVIQKLDGHGYDPSIGIKVLEDRSLVTIDKNNKLRMHYQLQLMGRTIIHKSSRSYIQGHRYEVFLSFRGGDTRATFTSHLYSALCNAGIIVFKDDVDLPRGNHIKTELLQAIGSSKIAIIILSREYAASKWCLEELSIIMELHESNDQVVLPVFYDVDPSEIRNQNSSFGEAFKDLIQRISPLKDQVSKWRIALAEVGGIAGFVVLGSRDESEIVKAIVKNVCDILDKKVLLVADYPVGVDNRVQEVIKMLRSHRYEDVIMVGIWGMGGTGKTTIAKAIYNELGRTFESRSYLSKIREVWDQEKDLVGLQNQLLYEICKTTKMEINNIESGKITLSDRLHEKKALVVLDDVDESTQLKALVGSRNWFKPGSIIIITTRNQRVLFEMNCAVYPMKNLDEGESIKLFSWHAFKQESPKDDFTKLSKDIVAYSGGLPLALQVLGSYLLGREVKEWESALEKLKKIPNEEIQKKLKLSFDGLDDLEKEIFLDISCFFIGTDKYDVTQILNGCEFAADIGIKTLMERSLVTIDEKNNLDMHDLLRNMGREIIRKQSQNEPGKRSRLWFHKDALAVLSEHVGTEAIEGLSLKLTHRKKKHIQIEAFEKMNRLRLLHFDNVQAGGDYKYISRHLRWLCWHGFPIKYIPSNFYQKKLVAIDLKYSNLRQVWREPQLLKRLKILNLSHSTYLRQTPDFSKLPNLEKLILQNCPSLSKIHDSIGLLDKLLLLDLEDCVGLCSLPRSIYRLKCLKALILSGCVMIEKLEEDIERMESLTTLIAPTIKQVPFSIVKLQSILHLSVCGYEGLSHHVIPSLYQSRMSPTNNPQPLIPTHTGLPLSILWDMLNGIPGHPSTILSSVSKQQSLLFEDGLKIPDPLCATNFVDITKLENFLGHLLIQIGKNSQIISTLSKMISQRLKNITEYSDDCVFPGDNYPFWLSFNSEGASVKFKVPLFNDRDHLKGMIISSVYSDLDNNACKSCMTCLMIINYTRETTLVYTEDKLISLEEAERKEIISNLESDDQVEVKIVLGNGSTVKKISLYLIYNESFDEQMEPSTSKAANSIGTKHKYKEDKGEEEICGAEKLCFAYKLRQKAPTSIEFHGQVPVKGSETFMRSLSIHVGNFNKVFDILLDSISQGWNDGGLEFSLPGDNYPNWLAFVDEGSSVSFKVPQVVGRHLKGVILYVIYSSLQESMTSVHSVGILIKNFMKATMYFYQREVTATSIDEEW